MLSNMEMIYRDLEFINGRLTATVWADMEIGKRLVPFSLAAHVFDNGVTWGIEDVKAESESEQDTICAWIVNLSDEQHRQLDRELEVFLLSALVTIYLTETRVLPAPVRQRTAMLLQSIMTGKHVPLFGISCMTGIPFKLLYDLWDDHIHYPLTMNEVIKLSTTLRIPLSDFLHGDDDTVGRWTGHKATDELCRLVVNKIYLDYKDHKQAIADTKEIVEDYAVQNDIRQIETDCFNLSEYVKEDQSILSIAVSRGLRLALKRMGLTAKEAAQKLDWDMDVIQSMVNRAGLYTLRLEALHCLCDLLNVPVEQLTDIDAQPPGLIERINDAKGPCQLRTVDDLGRIVLPMRMRHRMGIAERDKLLIACDGEQMTLKKA